MYDDGRGVPQDYAQALVWLRKAADQGNAAAQTNLGAMYGLGLGVPRTTHRSRVGSARPPSRGTPPRRATSE